MSQLQPFYAGLRSMRGFVVAGAAVVFALSTLAIALMRDAVATRADLIAVDTAGVGASLCAVLACGWAARRNSGRLRTAWGLLCLTAALWSAGNLVWVYFQVRRDTIPFPSLADAFYLVAIGAAVIGLLSFPTGRNKRAGRASILVDALVVGSSLWFTSGILVLPPVLRIVDDAELYDLVLLAYPIGAIVVLTLAIMLFARAPAGSRLHLGVLALAFVVCAVAGSVYAYLGATGSAVTDGLVSPGWVGESLIVALAALAPSATTRRDATRETAESVSVVGSVIVYGTFLMAMIAAAIRPAAIDTPGPIISGMIVLILFGVRQTLLAADNKSLRRDLENKVDELDRLALRYERILDGVAEGIYGVDVEGRVNFVNPAAAGVLGYPAEELLGRPAHECFHHASAESTATSGESCHLAVALRGAEVVRLSDQHYVRRDGRPFPVEIIASPIRGADVVTGAVVAFSDITQRREVEKMKEEFISVVSHELRTPLTSIRGSLGLIAGGAVGQLPEAAARMVGIALDNSDRLTRLINDILDLERIGSGTVPMDFSVADAAELVSATLTVLQPVAAQAGVELRAGTVEGRVHADGDRIIQALTNLVGNAIKFSPAGSCITVGAREEGSHVTFEIADRGRGIPANKLAAVFERFQQVDSSDAREKGGTGLGLPITKSIVERHGGRIWVDSVPGQGSTFRFTLPAAKEPVTVRPEGSSPSPAIAPATVLVCDDDPDILEVLGTLLRHQGYATTPVARGRDAVDRAVVEHPDVILLDLRMPGMSGWEAIAELKSRPETRDIPIVVMSGLSPVSDPDLASQTEGWLTKPIDDQEIRQALAHALGNGKRRATVLVVEDDVDLASVLVTMFERRGLHVVHAATETEAVARCREVEPDVLVLDLYLPDGDGFGVVEALRSEGRLQHVPVIIYSAHDLDMSSRNRLRLGEMVFLTKGHDSPQELEKRVAELIHSVARNGAGSQ